METRAGQRLAVCHVRCRQVMTLVWPPLPAGTGVGGRLNAVFDPGTPAPLGMRMICRCSLPFPEKLVERTGCAVLAGWSVRYRTEPATGLGIIDSEPLPQARLVSVQRTGDEMDITSEVVSVLDEVLSLNGRARAFSLDTPLLGALPELDSMAGVALITNLEERFGFCVDDDEMDGSVFASLASLVDFVTRKMGG